jgi:probable phosphoglycerate mutase
MHDISSRVLRGLLTGMPPLPECGAPLGAPLQQGKIVEIGDGAERVIEDDPS